MSSFSGTQWLWIHAGPFSNTPVHQRVVHDIQGQGDCLTISARGTIAVPCDQAHRVAMMQYGKEYCALSRLTSADSLVDAKLISIGDPVENNGQYNFCFGRIAGEMAAYSVAVEELVTEAFPSGSWLFDSQRVVNTVDGSQLLRVAPTGYRPVVEVDLGRFEP